MPIAIRPYELCELAVPVHVVTRLCGLVRSQEEDTHYVQLILACVVPLAELTAWTTGGAESQHEEMQPVQQGIGGVDAQQAANKSYFIGTCARAPRPGDYRPRLCTRRCMERGLDATRAHYAVEF